MADSNLAPSTQPAIKKEKKTQNTESSNSNRETIFRWPPSSLRRYREKPNCAVSQTIMGKGKVRVREEMKNKAEDGPCHNTIPVASKVANPALSTIPDKNRAFKKSGKVASSIDRHRFN